LFTPGCDGNFNRRKEASNHASVSGPEFRAVPAHDTRSKISLHGERSQDELKVTDSETKTIGKGSLSRFTKKKRDDPKRYIGKNQRREHA